MHLLVSLGGLGYLVFTQETRVRVPHEEFQSYSVVVSTSVVPTEIGGSIPPRTCGRDADHSASRAQCKPPVVKKVMPQTCGCVGLRNLCIYTLDCVRARRYLQLALIQILASG